MEALAANGTMKKGSWEWEMSEACRTGLSVRPKRGNAVLFYSQDPGGRLDPRSLHGGCPVLSNVTEKWAANIWLWNAPQFGCERTPGAEEGAAPGYACAWDRPPESSSAHEQPGGGRLKGCALNFACAPRFAPERRRRWARRRRGAGRC